jgi:hypothetical protein
VRKEFDGLDDDVAQVLDERQRQLWRARLGWFRKTWIPRASPPSP